VASWSIQLFGHNRHGPKTGRGLCPFFGGELGPHLAQYGLGRGLPPYQVAFWSIQPFGHNRHQPKIGGVPPFLGTREWAGSHPTRAGPTYNAKCYLDPSSRLAAVDMGRRLGGCAPLEEGELGPHLTQCGQGRDLPACQVSSSSIQPFGHSAPTSQTGQTMVWWRANHFTTVAQ